MTIDLRRAKRYEDFIAVTVLAGDPLDENRQTNAYNGRLINISLSGACLLLPNNGDGPADWYRSACKKDFNNLQLEIQGSLPPEIKSFSLIGKPIWMAPFVMDDIYAFKMGIAFDSQNDFEQSQEIIQKITAHPESTANTPRL